MDKSISSEEKLLKVIRNKDRAPGGQKKANVNLSDNKKDNGASDEKKKSADALNAVSKFLVLLSIILFAYIVVKAFVLEKNRSTDFTIAESTKVKESVQKSKKAKQVPYSTYEAKFAQRDIFDTSFYKGTGGSVTEVKPPPMIDPTATLNLVGVILDDQAQAIIEDAKNNQTLFLYEGDKINDLVVDKIEESKVILTYKGQLFELSN